MQTVSRPVDNWSESLTTEASVRLLMPERKDAPFFLRQLTGPGAPHDWSFMRDRTVIGRSKAADFAIDSPELSRQHICILRDGKSFKCLDLESRNGIYLDGVRIHSLILRHGDLIQLGNVSFLFCEGV
ncbi:MAG: FHA domain-containing protein [Deltaproteobacteria bacterium]|nr:FHA domain-containing protein [Deltaproteobacteria bacterium]